MGERPTPDAPHPGKWRSSQALSCRSHSAQSQLARAGAVGLVTGPHAHIPRTHSQWVVGPGRTPQKDGRSGVGERLTPDAPHPGKRHPPQAPACRPHSAQSQLARARAVGLVTGPHAHTRCTHSQWVVGPGRTPQKDGRSGVGEHPTPDVPPPGKRRPPRVPACCPHSAQSGLARARAVRLVTGPNAQNPRTHSQWVVDPGRTPKRTGGREWESARPPTPHTQARGLPPGPPVPPQERAKPAHKPARCGVVTGPQARTPRTHSQWVVGPGLMPQRTRGRGWEGARPQTFHTQARGTPPRGPSCRSHSSQSQLARARAVGLVTGPHAHIPRNHSQWVVGPGRKPERTGGRGWESARPRGPHTKARGAPPRRPPAAPTARKASTQERALWGR